MTTTLVELVRQEQESVELCTEGIISDCIAQFAKSKLKCPRGRLFYIAGDIMHAFSAEWRDDKGRRAAFREAIRNLPSEMPTAVIVAIQEPYGHDGSSKITFHMALPNFRGASSIVLEGDSLPEAAVKEDADFPEGLPLPCFN